MIIGAFGTLVDPGTHTRRVWYQLRDGVKRWRDTDEIIAEPKSRAARRKPLKNQSSPPVAK